MLDNRLCEALAVILCIVVMYLMFTFVVQAHFTSVGNGGSVGCATDECPAEEISRIRDKVTYPQSHDWYPMSYGFTPPVTMWRHWIRQYRQDNRAKELGNYGIFDIQSAKQGKLVDPVGVQYNVKFDTPYGPAQNAI